MRFRRLLLVRAVNLFDLFRTVLGLVATPGGTGRRSELDRAPRGVPRRAEVLFHEVFVRVLGIEPANPAGERFVPAGVPGKGRVVMPTVAGAWEAEALVPAEEPVPLVVSDPSVDIAPPENIGGLAGRESMGAPTISILIPAYNEERNLPQLLQFLRAHPPAGGRILEVLVDVSGSQDGTRSAVARMSEEWPIVRMIDVCRRDGLLRAMRRLAEASRGDIAVRIDADVRLDSSTLPELLVAMTASRTGIASPRIVPEATRSRLVNYVTQAEWELHHRVSLESPKTTLVQAFRRLPIELPEDAGLEDVGLQEQVEMLGLRPAYVPGARIWTKPPSSLRGLLLQRVRTIVQIRNHRARGYSVPATASKAIVGRAILSWLRDRPGPLLGLVGFLALEATARFVALVSVEGRKAAAFAWDAAEGTKEIDWTALPR